MASPAPLRKASSAGSGSYVSCWHRFTCCRPYLGSRKILYISGLTESDTSSRELAMRHSPLAVVRLLFAKSASPHHGFAAFYTYLEFIFKARETSAGCKLDICGVEVFDFCVCTVPRPHHEFGNNLCKLAVSPKERGPFWRFLL